MQQAELEICDKLPRYTISLVPAFRQGKRSECLSQQPNQVEGVEHGAKVRSTPAAVCQAIPEFCREHSAFVSGLAAPT